MMSQLTFMLFLLYLGDMHNICEEKLLKAGYDDSNIIWFIFWVRKTCSHCNRSKIIAKHLHVVMNLEIWISL